MSNKVAAATAATALADSRTAERERRWVRAAARTWAAAGGLWLAFVVVQAVTAGRVWWWHVVWLAPPIAMLVVPLVLLLALWAIPPLRRRSVRFAVVGVALNLLGLVVGWPANGVTLSTVVGLPGASPSAATSRGPDLRVVSWNTQYWEQTDAPARFYGLLQSQDADVYLLQEYLYWDRGPTAVDRLQELTAHFPGYHVAKIGELVTLSRLPVVDVATPGAATDAHANFLSAYESAKVLRVDVLVDGRRLSLYNVHITVPVDAGTNPLSGAFYSIVRERDRQRARQAAALTRDLDGNPNPVVLAGDFNTTRPTAEFPHLRTSLIDMAEGSPSPFQASWPDGLVTLWRLDFAFRSEGVSTRGYALVGSQGMSDHRLQLIRASMEQR